jgi:hypothetical protein
LLGGCFARVDLPTEGASGDGSDFRQIEQARGAQFKSAVAELITDYRHRRDLGDVAIVDPTQFRRRRIRHR